MLLRNPYTKKYIDYPLDLSDNNIVVSYRIEHETVFSQWLVAELKNGDVIYIPSGDKNERNIYVITSFYRTKEVQFPYGIYIINSSDFTRENIHNNANYAFDKSSITRQINL